MASEKTFYWLAVAIMTVLLGNHFAAKYQRPCLADRAMAAVQQLSSSATEFLAMGQNAFAGSPRLVMPELAMARVQGRFASMQAGIARQQAACARLEAQRARMMVLQQMSQMRVICPRQAIQVEIPQVQVVAGQGTI
ncbi:MAG TPA: hypothetical protein VFB28_00465 [Terriglobales bacterium]|nr:hypothetical protein [Terriglobales bacterium]